MIPVISIIIPCYNSETTLEQTLKSLIDQTYQSWEAIIINDGSLDRTKEIALFWVKKDERFKYISKRNEGLGKARNLGVEKAVGSFILPLDSDNLIIPDFIENALNIFKNQPQIGVVHGYAEFIGEKDGLWQIPEFDFEKILVQNYIDACAIFRKDLWEKVGGYDEEMPYQGNEDWELWIAFGIIGVKFYHLNKITFKYRISSTSMNRSYTKEIREANEQYIAQKYSKYYHQFFLLYRSKLNCFNQHPLKSAYHFLKKWYVLNNKG